MEKPAVTPAAVTPAAPTSNEKLIPLSEILVDWKDNISRQFFDTDAEIARMLESDDFKDLCRSMKGGQINPVIVTLNDKGDKAKFPFRLKVGFRRYYAAKVNGTNTLTAKVMDGADALTLDLLNWEENAIRKNLTPYQNACAATELYRRHKLESPEAAKRIGLTPGYLRNLVALKEGLAPEILSWWSRRDESDYPAEFSATSIPDLTEYAQIKEHKAQVAEFKMRVEMARGKTEEEAKQIVEAGGFKFSDASPAGGKKGKKGGQAKSIQAKKAKALRDALNRLDLPPEDRALRDAAVQTIAFLLSKSPAKIKVGKVVLFDPAWATKESKEAK